MRLVIPRRNHTIVGRRKIVARSKALQKVRIVYREADQVFLMRPAICLVQPVIIGYGVLEPQGEVRVPKIDGVRAVSCIDCRLNSGDEILYRPSSPVI